MTQAKLSTQYLEGGVTKWALVLLKQGPAFTVSPVYKDGPIMELVVAA